MTSSIPTAPPIPTPGTVLFNRFELRAPLGAGGSARVWRAHDRARGHDVAIKLLVHADDASATRRLLREGEALSRVHHPGVVRVLDVFPGPPAALALELVDGGSLRQRLDEELLPVVDVLRLAAEVVAALAAAHAAGVAHRDLKPENILLAGDRTVVVDFGLAAPVVASASTGPVLGATTTTSIHGTPAYLAPELVEPRDDIDAAAADRYALGVVLLECLLGDNPYRAPTIAQTLARHVEKTPPSPSSARPSGEVPDAFAAVVVALLAREPSSRPSLDAVLAAARGDQSAALPSSSRPSSPASLRGGAPSLLTTNIQPPSARLRATGLVVAAAAALSLLVIATTALTSRTRSPPTVPPLAAGTPSSVTPPGVSTTAVTPPPVVAAPASSTPRTLVVDSSPGAAGQDRFSSARTRGRAGGAALVTDAAVDAGVIDELTPTGLPAKRRYLQQRCARFACAALGDAEIPTDLVALRRYRDDVDACLARCR
jgi:serine/threonine-protein kinase